MAGLRDRGRDARIIPKAFLGNLHRLSAQSLAEMATANDRLISSEHVAVDQVSTAATEMGAAVHEVARNVQNAADAARQAEVQSR